MKKQELVHLHSLFAEIADHCADEASIDMDSYHALETRPTSIHRSKADHKEAVFTLVDGLASTFLDDGAEIDAPSIDAD